MTPVRTFLEIVRESFGINRTVSVHNYDYYQLPPPLPIPQQPKEKPNPKMLPEGFINIVIEKEENLIRNTPTPTSTRYEEYTARWCGTTENNLIMSGSTDFNDWVYKEKSYDEKPLKHFLMKKFDWIEDVTEVKKRNRRGIEVHITVSPIHHTELMNPILEKLVREKLYEELVPLVTCMYEDIGQEKPIVIFSPSPSETILEHFR